MSPRFLLLLLVFSCNTFGKELLFVTLEFPPIAYYDKQAKAASGFAVEAVQKIAKNLGHNITIKVLPWTRGLNMVKEGEADAIFTIYKNPEREKFIDFTNEVFVPQSVSFYVNSGSEIDTEKPLPLDGLTQYKIGVVSTISYGKKFDQVKSKLDTSSATNLVSNFKKLANARVDLVPSNIYVGDYTLSQKKGDFSGKIKRLSVPFDNIPSYIGFSKKKSLASLRDQFDQELKKMNEAQWIEQVLNNYK
ncbi:substrate-binding periplasmic protein [Spartinivicinus ruber]|uniref:substrate-binding periplasmic protein n=1 Tax=Spartinivicinus ruber TaxID=2683272 RepID=UPI0013D350C4|nr:transporter substrate-binding domain-containing protein [Spartinivicinus ruber]